MKDKLDRGGSKGAATRTRKVIRPSRSRTNDLNEMIEFGRSRRRDSSPLMDRKRTTAIRRDSGDSAATSDSGGGRNDVLTQDSAHGTGNPKKELTQDSAHGTGNPKKEELSDQGKRLKKISSDRRLATRRMASARRLMNDDKRALMKKKLLNDRTKMADSSNKKQEEGLRTHIEGNNDDINVLSSKLQKTLSSRKLEIRSTVQRSSSGGSSLVIQQSSCCKQRG